MKIRKKETQFSTLDPDIIVYGGIFDPPHEGHLHCITTARQRFAHAKILIVQTPESPASQLKKEPTLNYEKRRKLCELSFREFMNKDKNIFFSEIEKDLEPPYYTYRTLSELKKKYPKKSFCLLLGEDQWIEFSNWYLAKKILQKVSLLVISRSFTKDQRSFFEALKYNMDEFSFSYEEIKPRIFELSLAEQKTYIFYNQAKGSSASSTAIRKFLAEQKDLPTSWVIEEVQKEIDKKEFYKKK